MDNERQKHLIEVMKKINKDTKSELMDFADNSEEAGILYSGIKQCDNFLGGFKKGTFSVIWGGTGVGKSTLMLQTITNVQKENKIVCFIDMERSFDKDRAKELRINLQDLVLVSNCQTAEEALEIIRTLCKEKVVDLIILDSIQAMSPLGEQKNKGKERGLAEREMAELARTLSKFFRVVAPDVFRAKVACILIGQIRMSLGSFIVRADLSGGEALKHWAYINCFMRRGQNSDAPVKKFKEYWQDPENKIRFESISESIGFDTVLHLKKTKSSSSAKEGSEIHLPFLYDRGFVNELNLDEEPEIRIDPEATDEEKEKITKYLIEKGILQEKKSPLSETNPRPKEEFDNAVITSTTIEGVKITKEDLQNKEPKKKGRGRPKGKKNS